MVTEPMDNYTVVYLEQACPKTVPSNQYFSFLLGLVSGGNKKPWYGPLLVDYEREGALSFDNFGSEVSVIARCGVLANFEG